MNGKAHKIYNGDPTGKTKDYEIELDYGDAYINFYVEPSNYEEGDTWYIFQWCGGDDGYTDPYNHACVGVYTYDAESRSYVGDWLFDLGDEDFKKSIKINESVLMLVEMYLNEKAKELLNERKSNYENQN